MERLKTCRIYVLTIEDKAHARPRNAAMQLDGLGLRHELVTGFTPQDIKRDAHFSPIGNALLMKRSLSDGEICCYAGHRLMWRRFLDDGASHALFMEDDFSIADGPTMTAGLEDCLSAAGTWDVLKLFDYNPKKIVQSRQVGATRLVAYKYPASGNVAYMMNRSAAKALLERRRFFRPVDEDMAHMWEFGIRIWSMVPNPVSEASTALGGSSIEAGRTNIKRRRNLARSLWGNVLQLWKLGNSIIYRRRMMRFDR